MKVGPGWRLCFGIGLESGTGSLLKRAAWTLPFQHFEIFHGFIVVSTVVTMYGVGMDPAIAATLIGVLVAALLGVFAGAFHLLRSDIKEYRTENRADHRATNERIDRLEGKVDRLEGKVDMLIMALARAGFLVDPQAPPSPDLPS